MVDRKLAHILKLPKKKMIKLLWKENSQICEMLRSSINLIDARMRMATYLQNMENQYFYFFSDSVKTHFTLAQRNHAKESIRVLRNFLRVENEKGAGFSALDALYRLAREEEEMYELTSEGFICEFIYLFRGIHGKSIKAPEIVGKDFREVHGRESALIRSQQLDDYSSSVTTAFRRYRRGTSKSIVTQSNKLRDKILNYFGATIKDWNDFSWHMKHIIKNRDVIEQLVTLSPDEKRGLQLAEVFKIDVHITPYYLSLFNEKGPVDHDRVIRSLVLPSVHYCEEVNKNRTCGMDLDFMGEKSCSPVDCITRRYPQILILKPFDACPQICVYCQRNWEIKDVDTAEVTKSKVDEAIEWIKGDSCITEVLLTGGDPLTLSNKHLDRILGQLSEIKHIERIRIGTRTLVTAPCRFDEELCEIFEKYHQIGKREIAIMTHFEHAREITPAVLKATTRIRKAGLSIYNQQVFTYYNSRRFETCYLRKNLKLAGIDPYYCFNTKGKDETKDFRVPMARIEQEVKEEARLLPGVVRTDEPVFNVPLLGKSHLRAWQDHEPIMITSDGRRVYRFYPWERNVSQTESYIYTDVSIYDYLVRLQNDGENIADYHTIWYYF